jgi:hypothetical protein
MELLQQPSLPADYLIDKDGIIRGPHLGEGDYQNAEMLIQSC